VRDAMYGTLYFGGLVDAPLVENTVAHFHKVGEVGIGCWPDDPLYAMLPANPDYDGPTLYFPERSKEVALEPWMSRIPANFSLKQRDEQLFKQSFDYESTLASFGSLAKVMEQTIGMVVLEGDTVVCEAATGAPTQGRMEVGATTAESYRQRGFATSACASLIRACEARGLSTWWDCAKQNVPSVKLAQKLGYGSGQEYRYVWWGKR